MFMAYIWSPFPFSNGILATYHLQPFQAPLLSSKAVYSHTKVSVFSGKAGCGVQ